MKCKNCRNLIHKESDFRFPWCPIFDDCYDIEAERECPKFERMSNADKIRNMSDEELAENVSCPYIATECIHLDDDIECEQCKLQWLKSEVKE